MKIRRPQKKIAIIDVEGDVTGESESALSEAFAEASSEGTETIVFNFSELGYMNSSGIGLLVTTLIRAQRQDQKLMAYGLTPHYREIFALTRLDEAITIHDDESQVLQTQG